MANVFYAHLKKIGKSDYKFVKIYKDCNNRVVYRALSKLDFASEREAAIYVDKVMISRGKEPVNILKRKLKFTT